MSENILETTIDKDSIKKVLDEKPIEGIESVHDLIKRVVKGETKKILGGKKTASEIAIERAEKTLQESYKKLKNEFNI